MIPPPIEWISNTDCIIDNNCCCIKEVLTIIKQNSLPKHTTICQQYWVKKIYGHVLPYRPQLLPWNTCTCIMNWAVGGGVIWNLIIKRSVDCCSHHRAWCKLSNIITTSKLWYYCFDYTRLRAVSMISLNSNLQASLIVIGLLCI